MINLYFTPIALISFQKINNAKINNSQSNNNDRDYLIIRTFCVNNSIALVFEFSPDPEFLKIVKDTISNNQNLASNLANLDNNLGMKHNKIGSTILFYRYNSNYIPHCTDSELKWYIDSIQKLLTSVPFSRFEIKDGKLFSIDNENLLSLIARLDKLKSTILDENIQNELVNLNTNLKTVTKQIKNEDIPDDIALEINNTSKRVYMSSIKSLIGQFDKTVKSLSTVKYAINKNVNVFVIEPIEKWNNWSYNIGEINFLISNTKNLPLDINAYDSKGGNKVSASTYTFQDIVSKQKNGSNLIQIDVQFADIPFYIFGIEQSDYSSILRCMSRISGLEYKVDFDKSIRITRDSVNSNIVKNLKPSLIENKIIEYLPYSYRNYINFKKEELKNSNLLPIRIREDIKKFHSLDFNFISKQIVLNNDKGELYSNLSPDIKNLINNFIMLEIMKINSRYLMECPEYIDDVRNGELILKIRPDGSGTIQIKSIKSGKSVYYQGIARKK